MCISRPLISANELPSPFFFARPRLRSHLIISEHFIFSPCERNIFNLWISAFLPFYFPFSSPLLLPTWTHYAGFKKAMDHFLKASQHFRGNVRIGGCRRYERQRLVPRLCRWMRRNRLKKMRSRRWTSVSSCTWTCLKQSPTPWVVSSPVDRWVLKGVFTIQNFQTLFLFLLFHKVRASPWRDVHHGSASIRRHARQTLSFASRGSRGEA